MTTTTADTTSGSVAATPPPEDAEPRATWSARHFATGLVVAAAVGLAIRVMNVFWWRPTTDRAGYLGYRLWGDAFYYHHQANTLADGKFFINPIRYVFDGVEVASAGHPPLYSTYLALWSLVGIDGVSAHRVASGLLGVATVVVVGLVGRRIAGAAVGLIAAAIVAVYPYMWINDGMLMSESMAVLMAALVLAAAYSFWETPGTRQAVLLGLACAGSALTRSEMLLLLPLLILPMALLAENRSWKERIKLAIVGGVVAVAVITPWVAYNMTRFENPVYLSTGIGHTLQQTACDEVFYGNFIGYYWPCYTYPPDADELDESVKDELPREYALDYLKAHKERIPLVVAARVGRMWGFFKPGQTTALDWSFEGRGRVPSWLALFTYYAMLPFAVYGVVTLVRRKISIIPILAPAVIATFAAATTFGLPRYRAPAEVGLVLVAAIGIYAAWTGLRARRARSESVA